MELRIDTALTTPAARRMLGYISPIYSQASRFLSILDALGTQMEDAYSWSQELAEQAVPQTATWTLHLWEAEYALKSGDASDEARRAMILNKLRAFAAVNPWTIAQCASAATGIAARVIENTDSNEFTLMIARYTADEARLRSMIDEIKPAHLVYKVGYEENVQSSARVACGTRFARRYALGMLEG